MRVLIILAMLFGGAALARAADEGEPNSDPEETAARQRYFLLPIEIDSDSGAPNGDALISRVLPPIRFPSARSGGC